MIEIIYTTMLGVIGFSGFFFRRTLLSDVASAVIVTTGIVINLGLSATVITPVFVAMVMLVLFFFIWLRFLVEYLNHSTRRKTNLPSEKE